MHIRIVKVFLLLHKNETRIDLLKRAAFYNIEMNDLIDIEERLKYNVAY